MRKMMAVAAMVAATVVLGGQARAQDLMSFADANMDGKVSLEEYKAFLDQGWMFLAMGADKVKLADVDPMYKGAFSGVPVDAQGFVTQLACNHGHCSRHRPDIAVPARRGGACEVVVDVQAGHELVHRVVRPEL